MKIIVDEKELLFAFEMNSMNSLYYLNLKDGCFKAVLDKDVYDISEDEDALETNDPKFGYDLWQQVPLEDSWEGYNRMVAFTDSLHNLKLKNMLSWVLNKNKPFRRFKDILLNYPDERNQFFEFEEKNRDKKALAWIAELEEKFDIIIEFYYDADRMNNS